MWQWPRVIYRHLVPWDDPERLVYLQWYTLAGLASVCIVEVAKRLTNRRLGSVSTAIVALLVSGSGVISGTALIPYAKSDLTGITARDVTVVSHVGDAVPRDQLILTDGLSDSGAWIPLLTGNQTLLTQAWPDNSAAPRIERALQNLCAPGSAAELHSLHVQWVFLGTHVTGAHYADRSCPAGTSGLEELVIKGWSPQGPHLYRVRG
jgi:hypothetical protein